MSAYNITRGTVRFIVAVAVCAVILFGPGIVVTALGGLL